MCLMLYLGTGEEVPLLSSADLNIEALAPASAPVRRHFSLPQVRFVGAHTGCSCGFPSIISETPIEYFDGMFNEGDERQKDVRSLSELLRLLARHVSATSPAELYAVGEGDEAQPAHGSLTVPLDGLDARRFFFLERYVYRVV